MTIDLFRPTSAHQTFIATVAAQPDAPTPALAADLPHHVTMTTVDHRVSLHYNDPNMLLTSADGQRLLLLVGVVYPATQESRQAVMRAYEQHGPAFIKTLNGDFALLLVDRLANRVLIGTDRMASRSILYSQDASTHIFSNSGYLHPNRADDINTEALACYLATGVHFNDLTFFRSTSLLKSGSLYQLQAGQMAHETYWTHAFTNALAGTPEHTVRDALSARIVEAVRRRYNPDRTNYVSLSAGHDSRTILGILCQQPGAEALRCFAYAHGAMRPNSDEFLAGQLAAQCGLGLQLIPSFDGRVVESLVRNAVLGNGLADVCDEVDAWVTLARQVDGGPRPVLFHGDHTLMSSDVRVETDADVLATVKMVDFRTLAWLEPFIGATTYNRWLDATRSQGQQALKETPAGLSQHDRAEYLWFRQRYRRRRVPWREQFSSPSFDIVAPLVDNDFLDLFLDMPAAMRARMKTYRATVRQTTPAMFTVPIASSASYSTFWPEAFRQQQAEVAAFIESYASPLDNILAPDILLSVLQLQTASHLNRSAWVWKVTKTIYQRLRKANILPATNATRVVRPVDPVTFLKRALVVRHYLALATSALAKNRN